jgi:membrane dipeptidase
MIPLFDLHCDTLTEMYNNNLSLDSSPLHISIEKAKNFSPYCQIFAIWSDKNFDDDTGFERYNKIIEYSKEKSINFSVKLQKSATRCPFLAVEDARILSNDISRLAKLYADGVRFLTLTWEGKTCIGGSWNTSLPLTDFGKEVVLKSFEMGIIPDISHASYECAKEVVELSEKYGKPIIATHSNSYSVCKHDRNLRDDVFSSFVKNRYIVGISLAPQHLNLSGVADISDILKHIEHYLSLGGENNVCLGCDFDGVATLPKGINDISDLTKLYESMERAFGKTITHKIFYQNAVNYFTKYL